MELVLLNSCKMKGKDWKTRQGKKNKKKRKDWKTRHGKKTTNLRNIFFVEKEIQDITIEFHLIKRNHSFKI